MTKGIRINEDGYLEVKFSELLEDLPEEVVKEVYQAAGFQDFMVDHLCDLLVYGYSEYPKWWDTTPLVNRLRDRILPLMDQITISYVKNLLNQIENLRTDLEETKEWASELNKCVPNGVLKPIHKKLLRKYINEDKAKEALEKFYKGETEDVEKSKEI